MRDESGASPSGLIAAIRAMQGATQAVDEAARVGLGVNRTDLRLLGALHRCGPLAPSALAEALGITAASTTVAVDRLVSRGLVRRSPDPTDGRRSAVSLSLDCERWLDEAYGGLQTGGAQLLATFSPIERATIARFVAASTALQERQADVIAALPPLSEPHP